jgi:hypothetical protein
MTKEYFHFSLPPAAHTSFRKGNHERSIALASVICLSLERSLQFPQAVQFLSSHVLELGHINPLHTLLMLSLLQTMTIRAAQRKPSLISSTIQEESTDIFQDPALFDLSLNTISQSLVTDSLTDEEDAALAVVTNSVLTHLLSLREELFDKTKPIFLLPTNYLATVRTVLQVISPLLDSKGPTCSSSRYRSHLTAAKVLACLVELWFIDPSLPFDSLKLQLEQGIQLCNWLKTFPTLLTEENSDTAAGLSPPQALQTVSHVLTFFFSAQIIEDLHHKRLRSASKLSLSCSFHWREMINTHSALSSSRSSTLNAPASLPPFK